MPGYKEWILFSRNDLKAAKVLMPAELFGSVLYHCQQAAEKALKGYLVFQKQKIKKTHDLVQLLEMCLRFDQGFKRLLGEVERMNPLSTKFRYPSEFDIPDKDDALFVIKDTQVVLNFVDKKIKETNSAQLSLIN